jgi:tetratricopeptide (TPR) repeat protein
VAAPFHRTTARGLGIAAAALLFCASPGLRADDEAPPQQEQPSLSDSVGDALGKIPQLIDKKDWVGAQALVDGLIPTVQRDSYDLSILLRTRAVILIQKGDYAGSLQPLEESLQIADRHHFNTPKQTMEDVYLLSELYYQETGNSKLSKDEQIADFERAIAYIQRWFPLNKRPNEEISSYYATLLFSEAMAKNGDHPDPVLVEKTRVQVEKTLHISVHPKDTLYILLLATLQQQGDFTKAAEVLELILEQHPDDKTYWPDLVIFYQNLAQTKDKDKKASRMYYVRAINALEKAQSLGYMKAQKDNYLLFTFYYETGQFGVASDLLYKGLMSGAVEPTLQNWQLLAASYQQINQDFKAIEVLKEAAKRFPAVGQFDFQIAQIYIGLDKNEEAYDFLNQAVETGGLDKPWIVYTNLAYSAYELGKFDEAKVAIEKAIELKGSPDHQSTGLKNAIDEAIKERDERKARQAAPPST